nr:hypothetical protein [Arcicella sp.]
MKTLYVTISLCLLISYTTFSQTISSNAPLCGNQNLTLELSATGGTAYAWKGPNGFTSTQQKPNIKNVNWKNRGVYTVTIDNKTTLTTDVNIKDPVAFTVPKEISVCEGGTLLIEPKSGRLTDSTEVAEGFSIQNSSGVYTENQVKNFGSKDVGIYKVTGDVSFFTPKDKSCPSSQNINVTIKKVADCKSIEIEDLSKVKMCYGQDISIPFTTKGNFKQGTKFKVYILRANDIFSQNIQPDVLTEKSPITLKITKYFDHLIRIRIVADDPEQTTVISEPYFYSYGNYVVYNNTSSIISTNSILCDSAKLSTFIDTDSFQWTLDGKEIKDATKSNLTVTKNGSYSIKFKEKFTSDINKTCLYESQPVKIELGKIPKPNVQDTSRTELCVGKPTTLFVYFPQDKTNYRWKKNGAFIANATNSFLSNVQEGDYQVEAKEGTCTVLSDTVKVKKPANLNAIFYFGINSVSPIEINNQQVYTLCNNQKFNFESGQVPFAKRQLFKNGVLVYEAANRYDLSSYSLQGEGTYFLKSVYGDCESISKSINIKYRDYIRGETYLQNNNLQLCEGSSAFFKLAFNGSPNYKLGDGLVYKDGKSIRKWNNQYGYYLDLEENKESGNYYGIGKAIFPDGSECLVKTDTVKVQFSKRLFQDVSGMGYSSPTNLITISTCKDTTALQSYNNLGPYGRETVYKWIKDGVSLKQDSSSTLQATQTGTYQLETTYKGGCTVVSSPYKVELGKINVSFYNPTSALICDGENYPLHQRLSEYSSKNVYFLSKDGQFFSDGKGILPNGAYGYFNLTQAGTYKLKVTNGKCEGTSPDFVLKVDKIPTTIAPTDSAVFCAGKTVDLKAS